MASCLCFEATGRSWSCAHATTTRRSIRFEFTISIHYSDSFKFIHSIQIQDPTVILHSTRSFSRHVWVLISTHNCAEVEAKLKALQEKIKADTAKFEQEAKAAPTSFAQISENPDDGFAKADPSEFVLTVLGVEIFGTRDQRS